ncbi:hypothetical protein JW911_03025 [Candidatus Peregrinibacteria bacterium]|nr:hypothetical protein [Candidatus Peregrinibacteria bacterium]
MEIMDHDFDEDEAKIQNKKYISKLIAQHAFALEQLINELKKIKTDLSKAVININSLASTRIDVTDVDLKYLEGILKNEVMVEEFWYAITALITDVNFMLLDQDKLLSQENKKKLDEIYNFLTRLKLLTR